MDLRRHFEHLSCLSFSPFLESFIGLKFLDFHLLDLTQPKPAASDSVSLLSGALSTGAVTASDSPPPKAK